MTGTVTATATDPSAEGASDPGTSRFSRLSLSTLNPVLDRELRERSRTLRSIVMLSLFLALLVLVLALSYSATAGGSPFDSNPLAVLSRNTGRAIFEWVLATQLFLLLFLIPGIAAGSVAGERDRQTLIPLQVTMVGPVGIFFGKVLSSSSFILLLVVAAAPVMTVPYLVGGISFSQVFLALLTLMILGVLLAAIGVACSALFRRTLTATLASYGMVLLLTLGTGAATIATYVIDASRGVDAAEPRLAALYPNPFVALADSAGDLGNDGGGPFSPIKSAFIQSQAGDSVFFNNGRAFSQRTGEPIEIEGLNGAPLWVRSLGSILLVAGFLSFFAIRRLRAPQRDIRP